MTFSRRDPSKIVELPIDQTRSVFSLFISENNTEKHFGASALKDYIATQIDLKAAEERIQVNASGVETPTICHEVEPEYKEALDTIKGYESKKNELLCLKNDSPFRVGGSIYSGSDESRVDIRITYDLCKVYTDSCDDEAKFQREILQRRLVFSGTYFTNVLDFDLISVAEKKIFSYTQPLEGRNRLESKVYYRSNKIETDTNGIINFIPIDKKEVVTVEKIDNSITNELNSKELQITMSFELDNNDMNTSRVYRKFDDLLAKLSIVVDAIKVILTVFYFLFETVTIEQYLAQKLYLSGENELVNIQKHDNGSESRERLADISKILKQNTTFKKIKKPSLKLKFSWCCKRKKSKNVMLFEKAGKYMDLDVDLISIVKRGIMTEKLLKVMFKQNQLELFTLINAREINKNKEHFDILEQIRETMPSIAEIKQTAERLSDKKEEIDEDEYLTNRMLYLISNGYSNKI